MQYRIDVNVEELNITELNECLKENTKFIRRWESICNKHTRYELAMEKAGKSITNAAKKDSRMSWNIYDSLKAHRNKIKKLVEKNKGHLMQCTGVKDCKDNLIFEGDIVYIKDYGDMEIEYPFIQLFEALHKGNIRAIKGNIYCDKILL